jgi:hypothetical protein
MATGGRYSAQEIKRLMLLSYKKYKSGALSQVEAYRENTMLANILKAIEASEQEQRIEALERALLQTRE